MDWAFCFSRVLEDHNILMFNNLITFDQSNSKFTFNLQTIPKFVEWSCWTFFISQWQQNDGWSRSPSHFVTHPHQNKVLLFISTVLYCFLRLQDILWHHPVCVCGNDWWFVRGCRGTLGDGICRVGKSLRTLMLTLFAILGFFLFGFIRKLQCFEG